MFPSCHNFDVGSIVGLAAQTNFMIFESRPVCEHVLRVCETTSQVSVLPTLVEKDILDSRAYVDMEKSARGSRVMTKFSVGLETIYSLSGSEPRTS